MEVEHWSTIGDLAYFTTNFAPKFARIWLMLKMDTCVDGPVLAVLAAYQNSLVTSKMMTSQVVQCLLF